MEYQAVSGLLEEVKPIFFFLYSPLLRQHYLVYYTLFGGELPCFIDTQAKQSSKFLSLQEFFSLFFYLDKDENDTFSKQEGTV